MRNAIRTVACVASLCALAAPGEDLAPAQPLRLTVRLEGAGKADLSPEQVRLAVFPGGRRCAFTYSGCSDPKSIERLTKMGFRTTLYCAPNSEAGKLRELEKAGAEIALGSYWGAKGGYGSIIESNTIQETFDAVVTSRLTLQAAGGGSVPVGSFGGHYSPATFPLERDLDRAPGYGAVFHDAHFLSLHDAHHDLMIFTGRDGAEVLATRSHFADFQRPQKVPNEIAYYQLIANQFLGTLRRDENGQIVGFVLRDFKDKDMDLFEKIVGKYGKHQEIWNATHGEVAAYESLLRQTKVAAVRSANGAGLEVELELERDLFPPFLLSPLCLQLPAELGVKKAEAAGVPCALTTQKDGLYVDIPLRDVVRGPCHMRLTLAEPNLAVPGTMSATLEIANAGKEPLEIKALEWIGRSGLSAEGPSKGFTLAPGETRKLDATLRTERGALFGITPIQVLARGACAGQARWWLEGFEVPVAPRLRAQMDPMNVTPMLKGTEQHFEVHLSNRSRSKPDGPADLFVHHKAGPCKGVLSFELPAGMSAEPQEIPFELKENDSVSLLVRVANSAWSAEAGFVKPVVRLDGEQAALELLGPGTKVIRDESLAFEPLDEKGLLVKMGWDDPKNGNLERCAGEPGRNAAGTKGSGACNDGVKGWCVESRNTGHLFSTQKNIDHREGTILFWFKRDPNVRNELRVQADPKTSWKQGVNNGNDGEGMIVTEPIQRRGESKTGISIRRYPGWKGKDGWVELAYQCLGKRIYYVQAPYENARMYEWRHCAMLWSAKERRLELYLDGKLAGKADPGEGPWLTAPWDLGKTNHALGLLTTDHGHWSGTCRDELYIYNRALSAEEIQANMELVKKK